MTYAVFAYTAVALVVCFVFSSKYVVAESGFHAHLSLQPFWNEHTAFSGIAAGAGLAALSSSSGSLPRRP